MLKKNHHLFSPASLCLFLLSLFHVPAYSEEILFFQPGDTISVGDATKFNLFQSIDGFSSAVLSENKKGNLVFEIYKTEDPDNAFQVINLIREVVPAINVCLMNQNAPKNIVCDLTTEEMSVQGKLIRWTGDGLEIELEYARFIVPIDRIKSFKFKVKQEGLEKLWITEDPNTTRLFFAPTGRTLKAGEGYFSVYEVVFPDFNYAFIDNFSLGGGIFPFSNKHFQIYWFTPKLGLYEKGKTSVSTGVLHFQIHNNFEDDSNPDESETIDNEEDDSNERLESFGIVYSVATYGSKDYSATIGIGLPYGKDLKERPVFMIGGEYRLSKRTKLISENWLLPFTDNPMFMLGIRWFGRNMAVDFALGRMSGMEFLAFPWVDFVINF